MNSVTTQTATPLICTACDDPLGLDRSSRAWAAVSGPAELDHNAKPAVVSIASRRWLDTKDRRGRTKTEPIAYGASDFQFLAQYSIARQSETRPKDREVHGHQEVFDDGSIDIGWASKVRHPRWKDRLENHTEASYRYLRRWAHSIQLHRNDAREKDRTPRSPKSWRKFSPNMLSPEARARWSIDRELDRLSRRADQYTTTLWNSILLSTDDGTDRTSAVGVKKADRVLALKLAHRRAEATVERFLNRNTTPVDAALQALGPTVRRTIARPLGGRSPEYWTALTRYLTVDLARREPVAYAALAEIEVYGAVEIPQSIVDALERTIQRRGRLGGGRTFAADLRVVLRGEPGDGQRILEAAAATTSGVRVATFKKNRAATVRFS